MFKTFAASDQLRMQSRAEAYDLFNQINFDAVSATFGAGNFGQVTSARTARVVQFGLKKES